MMRHLTFAVLFWLAAAPPVLAQPAQPNAEEAAILAVIDRFMHAIGTNDSAALAEIRIEGGSTIVSRPNAADPAAPLVTRRVFTPSTTSRPAANKERYWDPVVHVRGGIAVVWTPYEYWSGDKSSHCGIDVFDMMKDKAVWKIANAMWTVEPDACAALRPKDPSKVRPAG
jgi:hypothetical protein